MNLPLKIAISWLFLMSFSIIGLSQQSRLSSLFMYNKYDYIPAYAGLEGSLYITGNYRSQWQNLASNPVSQQVNAHVPLYFLSGAGGIKVQNHTQGAQRLSTMDVSYNYVLQGSWGLLSAGAKAGLFQYRLDGSELRTPDGNYIDGNLEHNDPRLQEDINTSIGAAYGLSVYFINNYFEGGLSIEQLPSYSTRLGDGSYEKSALLRFIGEVPIRLLNGYELRPSVMIQSDLVQTQMDLAATVSYSGNIFGGLGVRGYSSRSLDAVMCILGWRFDKQYSLAYCFDIGVSALRSVHQGTHEIQLNYDLNKKIGGGLPPKIIYNPRYM